MTDDTDLTPPAAPVLIEDSDGVRLLTLNRPEALNAFSIAMFDDVREALDEASEDPNIGCVAITATGRAFTSGSDLSGANDDAPPREDDPYDEFIARIETFDKPLVAAVNGLAVGIGTSMLGHCELVLAAQSARFRVPFTALGLVPEAGSTVTLPSLMGRQRATYALLTSRWVSAEEAVETGLVWRLTADEDLLSETMDVCREIASKPLESLVGTKRLLLESRLPAAHAARLREEEEFRRLLERPAHQEALAAFRERREPDFRRVAETPAG